MVIQTFPEIGTAPRKLWGLSGHCGCLSAWWILSLYGKRVSASNIIKKTRYTNKHGVFMVCLAVALHEWGIPINFYSGRDRSRHYYERLARNRARKSGLPIEAGFSIDSLIYELNKKTVAIVLYQIRGGDAHITPLTAVSDNMMIGPLIYGPLSIKEFEWGWKQPGILRQVILIRQP